jgi:hypothetical protein
MSPVSGRYRDFSVAPAPATSNAAFDANTGITTRRCWQWP